MISVERMKQYADPETVPAEAPLTLPTDEQLTNWPSKGVVNIDNVEMRYREELPLVLRGITLKVGVLVLRGITPYVRCTKKCTKRTVRCPSCFVQCFGTTVTLCPTVLRIGEQDHPPPMIMKRPPLYGCKISLMLSQLAQNPQSKCH